MDCSTAGFSVLQHLPELAQTHVHWLGDAIQPSILCCPPSLPALNLFPSIRVFQWVALCIKWPKYWGFSIGPSNEYSGLISFRIDWFNLLAIQGTLKSFPHKSFLFLPGSSDGKEYPPNVGDPGLIPGSRSSGGGNGNPLHYSCLENSMDIGTCWATVHGIVKSQTWLNN